MSEIVDVLKTALSGLNNLAQASEEAAPKIGEAIQQTLVNKEKNKYVSKRFSPSSSNLCSRFEAAKRLADFKLAKKPFDESSLGSFALGNATHEYLQNTVLNKLPQLWGVWACRACGRPHEGHQPSVCDECGESAFSYNEIYLRVDPYQHELFQIGGYMDGIWLTPKGWYILEIKTVHPGLFHGEYETKSTVEGVARFVKKGQSQLPLPAHVEQTQKYIGIYKELIDNKHEESPPGECLGAVILYVNRVDLQTKEFVLSYNEAVYKHFLNKIQEAKLAFEKNDAMLAPPSCKHRDVSAAKRCPLRDICFPPKNKESNGK